MNLQRRAISIMFLEPCMYFLEKNNCSHLFLRCIGSQREANDRQQAAADVHAPSPELEEIADRGRETRCGGERQRHLAGQDGAHHAHQRTS